VHHQGLGRRQGSGEGQQQGGKGQAKHGGLL
jgi:hypothetical protein